MEKFKRRLVELIEEKDLTQKELSQIVGVQEATVSRYITGDRNPTSEILANIADAFEVSVDYLLGRSDCKEFLGDYIPLTFMNESIKNWVLNPHNYVYIIELIYNIFESGAMDKFVKNFFKKDKSINE